MKKNLLLMMLCCPMVLAAQNGVTVSGLAVDAGTVTFNVSWKNTGMPIPWSDTVWVWVDYNVAGVMERLPVTSATASAGTVTKILGNDKGVWIAGNARTNGSFSATVELFTAIKDIGGACVYGSNYPPVGKYTSATEISFTGTPQYTIVIKKDADGTTETHTENSPYTVPTGYTVQSFIDKTGAPGIIKCISPATYTLSGSNVCAGANITLTLSGSQSGWRYQLYKGSTAIGNVVNGTGSALVFNEASTAAGGFSYTVQTVDATGAQCEIAVSNVRTITVNPVPGAPTMSGAGTHCTGSANITASVGTYGNGIKWDNSSTVTSRTVTASGSYRAITTSAAGCTSSTATVVVTIGTPSGSGSAPNAACGCASGLNDCDGSCQASCGAFNLCDGFTMMATGTGGEYSSARTSCQNRGNGWRLPTRAEMTCVCSNKSSLPITLPNAYIWTSTEYSTNRFYYAIMSSCTFYFSSNGTIAMTLCVK